jgi:hypothetical protein
MYRVKRLAIADFIGIPIFARKPDALVSMVFWDDRRIYQDGRRGDCTGPGVLMVLATVFFVVAYLICAKPCFFDDTPYSHAVRTTHRQTVRGYFKAFDL